MRKSDALKFFALNNLTIESEIRSIEKRYNVNLGHKTQIATEADRTYYPQFSEKIRDEASSIAKHYSTFYCLENSIRELIKAKLLDTFGEYWWDKAVPEEVRKNASSNQKKEQASGVNLRSHSICYTNFGELGEIIKANWDIFGDMFRDLRAVERILANLNTLRAPIAHCNPLAEDEVLRLHLSLRDWFRQME